MHSSSSVIGKHSKWMSISLIAQVRKECRVSCVGLCLASIGATMLSIIVSNIKSMCLRSMILFCWKSTLHRRRSYYYVFYATIIIVFSLLVIIWIMILTQLSTTFNDPHLSQNTERASGKLTQRHTIILQLHQTFWHLQGLTWNYYLLSIFH